MFIEHVRLNLLRAGTVAALKLGPAVEAADDGSVPGGPPALVLAPRSWCDGDFLRKSYGGWCALPAACGAATPLVLGDALVAGPGAELAPGAAPTDGALIPPGLGGIFWFGTWHNGSQGSAAAVKKNPITKYSLY